MDYSDIIVPVVGAIIGYSTNWIAIKMMFRPVNPIKIGNITLPFTPGIIPKNRRNIAQGISNTIANNLLTAEDLTNTLLSEQIKNDVVNNINYLINDETTSIKDIFKNNLGEDTYQEVYLLILNKISKSIYNNVKTKDLGNLVSKRMEHAINTRMSGSIIGIFGGKKIAETISIEIREQVNRYIDNEAEKMIKEMVEEEVVKFTNVSLSQIKKSGIDISTIILEIYEKAIIEKMPELIKKVNLEKIIEDKINSMDVLELEKMILGIMKKELNAIVNLGAVIGFVLGLINLLF